MENMITLAKQGDTNALQTLIETHQGEVYAFLLRRLNKHTLAEDATQETMIKVIKGISGYKEQGQFKSWVYRIARNIANDHLRKLQRGGGEPERLSDEYLAKNSNVSLSVERKERMELAIEFLDKLPPQEKEVMMLRVFDGYKFKEIAELTESPLNTVLGRMRNATLKMQQYMEDKEA